MSLCVFLSSKNMPVGLGYFKKMTEQCRDWVCTNSHLYVPEADGPIIRIVYIY